MPYLQRPTNVLLHYFFVNSNSEVFSDDLSQPLGEVWTDGLPAYRGMAHDHRYVVHDDGYVSDEGVHTN